jgi:two-component system sensor histidine kinase RegB
LIDSLTHITQDHLLQLRWLSVLTMMAAALVCPLLLGTSDPMLRLLVFAMLIGTINLCLLVTTKLFLSINDFPANLSPFVDLLFDLLAWGGYIYLSGGATNPLISVFLPLVAIGAIVLPNHQAWSLGLIAILIYSFLWYNHVPLEIADPKMAGSLHLFGMWLVFTVSTLMVIWFILQLTSSIRQHSLALTEAREQAIRDDWLISLGSQAAGAAHELSTPLATLNIISDDLLDDERLPPALAPDLRLLKEQVQTCKQTLSRFSARADYSLGIPIAVCNAGEWLCRFLSTWQSLNPYITLEIAIDEYLKDQHLAPDRIIEQTINNLLDNAVKASADHVRVIATTTDGHLEMTITDDGKGMTPASLAAFHQRRPAESDKGLGLGLLLGRAALERAGGNIHFSTPEVGGTSVNLRIPLASAVVSHHVQ